MNPSSSEYRKMAERAVRDLKKQYPDAFAPEETIASKDTSQPTVRPNSRLPLTGNASVAMTDDELRHLLRRTRFGVRKEEFQHFQGKTKEAVLDELLQPSDIDLPLNYYAPYIDEADTQVELGETFINEPFLSDEVESGRIVALKQWVMSDTINASQSIVPSMWLFWQNHFATELWSVFYAWGSYRYLKLLRDLSLGNFRELVEKITIDSIMLIYLNGARNRKDAPDENYARELQELFTLGKGPESQYIEQDVAMAARVLTGWAIPEYAEDPRFYAALHDTGDKQFSAFYDHRIIEGKSGEAGKEEYKELIDMIFEKNEVSKFICRRLYRYFIYAHIDDWTEDHVITPLAEVFRDHDYEIKPVLRTLLSSDHFYDELNHGAIIKSPVEFMVDFIATSGMPKMVDDPTRNFAYGNSMFWRIANLGQQIGDPPGVSGWPAYYQSPIFDKNWISTTTITQRIAMTDGVVWWGFWTKYGKEEWDYINFTKTLDHPEDPNQLIEEVGHLFCGYDLREDVRLKLRNALLSGQQSDHYWTDSWQEFLQDESDEERRNIIINRLRPFYHRFFQLPETQLK